MFADGVPPGAGGMGGRQGRRGATRSSSRRQSKQVPVETTFYCTLEEIYSGCKKKLKIRDRVVTDHFGTVAELERIVEVDVKPGWKEGVYDLCSSMYTTKHT